MPRVTGIFTGTAFSPGFSLRQFSSRCALRAGLNLPDKGLRYFKTVIVTADLYWRLDCSASKIETGARDVPAVVRHQPLYILFRVKQGSVFLINSRQRTVAAPLLNAREALFLSYDRFFAEFLNEKSPVPLGILAPAHLCWF